MSGQEQHELPIWAPRVRKSQIKKLYESSAEGLLGREVVDDVGFALYARCKSILDVSEAVMGRPKCPKCDTTIPRNWQPDEHLQCPDCNWQCPWKAYQKTYQRKNLNGGGMAVFIKDFVAKFPHARRPSARLVLIDTLIHRYHWEHRGAGGGRPGACGLIEGRMKNIIPFLDGLNYGTGIPRSVHVSREAWRQKWDNNPWSKGKGQS